MSEAMVIPDRYVVSQQCGEPLFPMEKKTKGMTTPDKQSISGCPDDDDRQTSQNVLPRHSAERDGREPARSILPRPRHDPPRIDARHRRDRCAWTGYFQDENAAEIDNATKKDAPAFAGAKKAPTPEIHFGPHARCDFSCIRT